MNQSVFQSGPLTALLVASRAGYCQDLALKSFYITYLQVFQKKVALSEGQKILKNQFWLLKNGIGLQNQILPIFALPFSDITPSLFSNHVEKSYYFVVKIELSCPLCREGDFCLLAHKFVGHQIFSEIFVLFMI